MTIEEALAAYLAANVDLTALVTKITPDALPQDFKGNGLTYEFQDGDETPYLSGEVNDLHRDTFLLTAVGDTRKAAAGIRDVLMATLGGIEARGLWQPGIFVSGCFPRTAASTQNPADYSERRDREALVSLVIIWGRR